MDWRRSHHNHALVSYCGCSCVLPFKYLAHRYEDLFKFHCQLLDMFPEEAGDGTGASRVIPQFPGRNLVSSGVSVLAPTKGMKRSVNKSAEEKRMPYIAKYLNELVKMDKKISRSEHVLRMFDDNWIPLPNADPLQADSAEPVRVLMSGFLTKRGAVNKSWKLRFHVLTTEGRLLYFDSERDHSNLSGALGEITIDAETTVDKLVGCKAQPSITWPKGSAPDACFWVLTPGRTYYFAAPDGEQAAKWIRTLKEYWLNVLRRTYESSPRFE